MAKKPILLTLTTLPSTTSPLNGFITMAVYEHLNRAWPVEGMILPSPMSLMVTTETMYLPRQLGRVPISNSSDSPILAATRALDILVQLLPEILLELGAKVGRVEEDGVRELALLGKARANKSTCQQAAQHQSAKGWDTNKKEHGNTV